MSKEDRFSSHLLDERQKEARDEVRGMFQEMEALLDRVVPVGREKSLALTKLEEASFWASAGIARS